MGGPLPCPAGLCCPGLRGYPKHPADRRVPTYPHGCSHPLLSPSARKNPKQGLRSTRAHLGILRRLCMGCTGLVQIKPGSVGRAQSDSTSVAGQCQVIYVCTPLPDSRGYNFEVHPLTRVISSTLRQSAAKRSPGTNSHTGGHPPQLFG